MSNCGALSPPPTPTAGDLFKHDFELNEDIATLVKQVGGGAQARAPRWALARGPWLATACPPFPADTARRSPGCRTQAGASTPRSPAARG